MGVLNVTPDSFSDGGCFVDANVALERALAMEADGAHYVDVGGESTRPGATPVPVEEELRRVISIVKLLKKNLSIPISVDTSKPQVMAQAIDVGADVINDVTALRNPSAVDVVAQSNVQVILMHMKGKPATMQNRPSYDDAVAEVCSFLEERIDACIAGGIPKSRLMVDPGFGFGKTYEHNLCLLKQIRRLARFDVPIVAGLSRKSMIGEALGGVEVADRLFGSVSAAVIAAWEGAEIVRAHDVKATVDAIKVCNAVMNV